MNKLKTLFERKSKNLLNIYFTAGYPALSDTAKLLTFLDQYVDIIEVGMPYSDPLADGPTIQASSSQALKNGMHLELLFEQINSVKNTVTTPIVIMGYLNQVLQYGEEKFLKKAAETGISGVILPDLPMDIYEKSYQALFAKYNISISFLITPQTSDQRIQQAASLSNGFLYVVAQSSITGKNGEVNNNQNEYFQRIAEMKLKCPSLIGFGIHDKQTFLNACNYANGAIIGSAFVKAIRPNSELDMIKRAKLFIQKIKN